MDHFRFGLRLTIGFVLIGTLIVGVFYFTLSPKVALFAYLYTGIAILTNWIYTAILLYLLLKGRISAKTTLSTVMLMALSIPIALFYSYAMTFFMSYARITFENNTSVDIGRIKIEGCQQKEIKNLDKGDSKTVWIKIPMDCRIEIEYQAEGKTRKETIAKFMPVSRGVIASYSLGSNRDIFESRN